MFFAVINRTKNKPYITSIVYLLIFFYVLSTNGCQTTSTERYTAESLQKRKRLEGISHIILKNGTYINTEDKLVFYYEKYADTGNVIIIIEGDTLISVNENGKQKQKFNTIEKIIPISLVNEVYVTRTEFDAGKTLLLIGGVIVGLAVAFVLAVIISLAAHPVHSCPYIYSFNGTKYIYDAEPLGGAICEALGRTDYSRLEFLTPFEGKFKIYVKNENDEYQHLDEMKLVLVNHDEGYSLTPDLQANFYNYKEVISPVSVTDETGKDITGYFKTKDDYRWHTDEEKMFDNNNRHTLKFKFEKPKGIKSALLFFNGGISRWGSQMVKNTISLHGNRIDDWYNEINKKEKEFENLQKYILSEETYYLKVNLLEDNGYTVRAVIHGGGPKIDEDKVYKIPLENVKNDFIEFTLNPPTGYWKFDQIGMIYEYEKVSENNIKELNASNGFDRNGKDVTEELLNTDKNYHEMPEIGNSFDLYFNVPEKFERKTCEVFLKTNGWYRINTDKSKNEQTAFFYELINTPGRIIEFSKQLYKQSLKELTEIKSGH